MATGNVSHDNGLSNFIKDGSQFSYDRLAEDVLNHLYDMFKVEKRLIPLPRLAKNSYRSPLAIQHIARKSRLDQIMYRGIWYEAFKRFEATFRTQSDITKLYEFVTVCILDFTSHFGKSDRKCTPFVLFHVSFAFIVELTLFLIMKKNRSAIKKMSRVWVMYFRKELKEAFEAYGGLSRVIREAKSHHLDDFVLDFIQTICVPYTGDPVNEKFLAALNKEDAEKIIAKAMKCELENWGIQVGLSFLNNPPKLGNDESEPDPLPALPVHERLGLVPHEDVLKKCVDVKRLPAEETPPEDTDDSTAKAVRALSLQAERRKAKKLLKERNPFSTTKTHLHHPKEKDPVEDAGASSVETIKEPEANPCDRVPPLIQHEQYQNDSQSLANSEVTGTNYSAQGARPRTRKF